MGVLGKDLFDFDRPRTHVKVQFGALGYWVEDNSEPLPYGATLTEFLNRDESVDTSIDNPILNIYLSTDEETGFTRERYLWFLGELFRDVAPEKKKGQRKKPLAQQIYESAIEAFVSGVSLGDSPEVDAPQVNIQYAVLEISQNEHELVEKMYFDRLTDFLYVEFMKGLQKGFVPKRCANCGQWFLQEPGLTYAYCTNEAPGEGGLTCRDIGSKASFREKVTNNGVWEVHQRAYKKYFARTKKGTMSKSDFEAWGREAADIRDVALRRYKKARTEEEKKAIVDEVRVQLNRL